MLREEVLKVWTNLKEKIKNSWEQRKVVVYRGHQPAQSVPPDKVIDDYHQQELLAILGELGVNTLGINRPAKTTTTYQEVIEAAKNFRWKWININESEKLSHLRELIMKGEIEELKKLLGGEED